MNDFFNFILNNPLILILVAGWLLSSLGSLGAKAARKAAQQQQQSRQEQKEQVTAPSAARPAPVSAPSTSRLPPAARPVPAPAPSTSRLPPAAAPTPRPVAPDPDEIAAELRRLMGLEPDESQVVTAEPPRPRVQPIVVEVEPEPRAPSYFETPGAALAHATAPPSTAAQHGALHRAQRTASGRILDIRNPAAALVALEVLGPPRSLKGW